MTTADPNRRPDLATTFQELLQNAFFARASEVEITTTPDDYGGTVVVVTDNGQGADELTCFTEPGATGWREEPPGETPGGHTLMDCLGHERFEIATRTGPDDPGRTTRHKANNARLLAWTDDPASLTPPGSGTTIRFRSPTVRTNTRLAAACAAASSPLAQVTIDGDTVPRGRRPATVRRHTTVDGIEILVEKNTAKPTHDALLHGILIALDTPVIPGEEVWTTRLDLSGYRGKAAMRRSRTRRDRLDDALLSESLREQAYGTLLAAIADERPPIALPTRILDDARHFGVTIAPSPPNCRCGTTPTADRTARRQKPATRRC